VAPKTKEKHWLLLRARRIRGQVEAIERALDSEQECGDNLVSACRGALHSLMTFKVLEVPVRSQAMSSNREKRSSEARAAQELVDVIRRYLK
jgi:DNA-binding FrmR family transcriptional regulator